LFYRTYVALGNHAADDGQMKQMFLEAQSWARTDQERAHMMLRLAKYHEKVGEVAAAAELAQRIAEQFAEEELVEVRIGPEADDSVRFGLAQKTVPGERLASDYLRGLIEKYGRQCYAKFDALAKADLQKACQAADPKAILAVAERWPNSQWTDDALFEGAGVYYKRAQGGGETADEDLGAARRLLYRVARMSDSPLRASAGMALAAIYARGGWLTLAQSECGALHDLPPETKVAFADIRGTLGELLKAVEGGRLAKLPKRPRLPSMISPPPPRRTRRRRWRAGRAWRGWMRP